MRELCSSSTLSRPYTWQILIASNSLRAGCDTPCMWLSMLVLVPQKGSRAKRLLVPPNSAYQQRLPTAPTDELSLVYRFVENCNTLSAFSWFSEKDVG